MAKLLVLIHLALIIWVLVLWLGRTIEAKGKGKPAPTYGEIQNEVAKKNAKIADFVFVYGCLGFFFMIGVVAIFMSLLFHC